MKGINFTFDEYDDVVQLITNIYLEADDWDFKVEITKEKNHYSVWIGDKDE
jgi:hypothetical protein